MLEKTRKTKIAIAITSSALVTAAVGIALDAYRFQAYLGSKQRSIQYDGWMKSPVVNFMLSGHPAIERETTGRKHQRVREVIYNNKVFWTTLNSNPETVAVAPLPSPQLQRKTAKPRRSMRVLVASNH